MSEYCAVSIVGDIHSYFQEVSCHDMSPAVMFIPPPHSRCGPFGPMRYNIFDKLEAGAIYESTYDTVNIIYF